jgi:hypothetical protein
MDQILRRGVIRVGMMPYSKLSRKWVQFENALSRKHNDAFREVSFSIYINEYAFCWKQDSAIASVAG